MFDPWSFSLLVYFSWKLTRVEKIYFVSRSQKSFNKYLKRYLSRKPTLIKCVLVSRFLSMSFSVWDLEFLVQCPPRILCLFVSSHFSLFVVSWHFIESEWVIVHAMMATNNTTKVNMQGQKRTQAWQSARIFQIFLSPMVQFSKKYTQPMCENRKKFSVSPMLVYYQASASLYLVFIACLEFRRHFPGENSMWEATDFGHQ